MATHKMTASSFFQAQTLAKGLLSLGLKEGDVVLSLGSSCPDSLLLFVAGSLIGVIFFVCKFHVLDILVMHVIGS